MLKRLVPAAKTVSNQDEKNHELKDDRVIQHIAGFGGIKKEEIGFKEITSKSMAALQKDIILKAHSRC
jgi:hypothetical protein